MSTPSDHFKRYSDDTTEFPLRRRPEYRVTYKHKGAISPPKCCYNVHAGYLAKNAHPFLTTEGDHNVLSITSARRDDNQAYHGEILITTVVSQIRQVLGDVGIGQCDFDLNLERGGKGPPYTPSYSECEILSLQRALRPEVLASAFGLGDGETQRKEKKPWEFRLFLVCLPANNPLSRNNPENFVLLPTQELRETSSMAPELFFLMTNYFKHTFPNQLSSVICVTVLYQVQLTPVAHM
ncbi:hypothetical protein BDZ89DRAFT_1121618 [Hymenopellis radicata]|nr:hypothetical protein BDZ89DRAFT_1121618 [Hymenopellis radicata]